MGLLLLLGTFKVFALAAMGRFIAFGPEALKAGKAEARPAFKNPSPAAVFADMRGFHGFTSG
jgi:hypothetical protein